VNLVLIGVLVILSFGSTVGVLTAYSHGYRRGYEEGLFADRRVRVDDLNVSLLDDADEDGGWE